LQNPKITESTISGIAATPQTRKLGNPGTQLFAHTTTTRFAQIVKSWRQEIAEILECRKPPNSKNRKVVWELLGQPAFHEVEVYFFYYTIYFF